MANNWETVTTYSPSIDLSGLDSGTYEIEVVAVSGSGLKSAAATKTITVAPQSTIPSDPQNLTISPIDEFIATLSWDPSTDLQVKVGGSVLVYHCSLLSGATWNKSVSIISGVAGNQGSAIVPLLEGTYFIKFKTAEGVNSINAASTLVTLCEPDPLLTISTIQEEIGNFTGSKSGLNYSATKGGLVLDIGALFDTFAQDGQFDDLPPIDSLGGVKPSGRYDFSSILDIGAICDVNFIRRLSVDPYNVASTFDENVGDIDTWGDFDGNDVTDANAMLYVRSTNNNPAVLQIDSFSANIDTWSDFDSGFATWSDWRICSNNLIRGRGFQFKMIATSDQVSQNLVVKELGVIAKLRQRIERSSSTLTSGATTYQVDFVNNFHVAPVVAIAQIQTYTGDYYAITSITNSGFQVTFYDSSANIVSRNFNYTAVGYGRRF